MLPRFKIAWSQNPLLIMNTELKPTTYMFAPAVFFIFFFVFLFVEFFLCSISLTQGAASLDAHGQSSDACTQLLVSDCVEILLSLSNPLCCILFDNILYCFLNQFFYVFCYLDSDVWFVTVNRLRGVACCKINNFLCRIQRKHKENREPMSI